MFSEGHLSKMKGLSKNIVEEEFFAVIQHLRKINIDAFDYLNMTQKDNTSKDLIDHYVSIYDDLSGNFEKYIRTLVFISKIFEGESPDYSKIKKDKLANHVSYLRNRPIFKDLVEPFDVT